MLGGAEDVDLFIKDNGATLRASFTGHDIEKGRLAGPIRADHKTEFATIHGKIEVVERFKTIKTNGDALCREDLTSICFGQSTAFSHGIAQLGL